MVKTVRGMKKTRSSELRKADTKTNRRYLIASLRIAVAAGLYIAIYRHSVSVQATVPIAQTVPASTANQETTSAPDMKHVAFGPTIPDTTDPPSKDPVGMVWIPGGEFSMGAQSPPDMDDE
jgi:formylglycine-generating enzyme